MLLTSRSLDPLEGYLVVVKPEFDRLVLFPAEKFND